jgi:PKD domain
MYHHHTNAVAFTDARLCELRGSADRSRARVERAVSLRRRIGTFALAALLSLSLVSTADAMTVSTPWPVTGQTVTFSETNGFICCNWTFGDGTTGSTEIRTVSHVYSAPGIYKVTASGFYMNPITHSLGGPFTTSASVVVSSVLPSGTVPTVTHTTYTPADPPGTGTNPFPSMRLQAASINVGYAAVELRRAVDNGLIQSWPTVPVTSAWPSAGGQMSLDTGFVDCARLGSYPVNAYFVVRDPRSQIWSKPHYVEESCPTQ